MESRHQVIETVAKQVKRKQIQRVSQLDVVNVTFSYEKPQRIYVTRTSSLARKWARLLSPCVRLFTKKQLPHAVIFLLCYFSLVWKDVRQTCLPLMSNRAVQLFIYLPFSHWWQLLHPHKSKKGEHSFNFLLWFLTFFFFFWRAKISLLWSCKVCRDVELSNINTDKTRLEFYFWKWRKTVRIWQQSCEQKHWQSVLSTHAHTLTITPVFKTN